MAMNISSMKSFFNTISETIWASVSEDSAYSVWHRATGCKGGIKLERIIYNSLRRQDPRQRQLVSIA
jgi:hypothetical protein